MITGTGEGGARMDGGKPTSKLVSGGSAKAGAAAAPSMQLALLQQAANDK